MNPIDIGIAGFIIGWMVCKFVRMGRRSLRVEGIDYKKAELEKEIRLYAKIANNSTNRKVEACARYKLDELRLRYRELEEERERLVNG